MHVLRHPNEVLAFVETYPDPCITVLIQQRMEELTEQDTMEDIVVFVILETDEGIEQLQIQMNMRVMADLGCPLWEVIEEHVTCYELVFVLSSSGFGTLVFVPKNGPAADILKLCQEYAYRPDATHSPDPPDPDINPPTPPTEAVFLRPLDPPA